MSEQPIEPDATQMDYSNQEINNSAQNTSSDAVWTYRGYRIRPGEFSTAMVHFYRAEISRANTWRNRLDITTNWALLVTGAALSVAFGQQEAHHSVIILDTLLITLFLFIEARRYRYYELWSYRVRLMETGFYAAMLVPPFKPDAEWSQKLAESLLHPHFPISMWEALGRRFRRNYMWIYLVLGLGWIAKVMLSPGGDGSLEELLRRSSLGIIPGWLVLLAGITFNATLLLVGILTWNLREATGEVLPRYGGSSSAKTGKQPIVPPAAPKATPVSQPPQPPIASTYLGLVTSNQIEPMTNRIKSEMNRAAAILDPNNTSGAQTTLMLSVTYSPCLKAGASAVNAGCRAFRRDFHRLTQYEMMPHLKTQTLLVEYFTWQPICHNRLYSVVKVPRLAQLPSFTPRAMRQLNEWKYSANGFNPQDFLRLISPYLKLGALRRFSVKLTEIQQLKTIAKEIDSQSVVIVVPRRRNLINLS